MQIEWPDGSSEQSADLGLDHNVSGQRSQDGPIVDESIHTAAMGIQEREGGARFEFPVGDEVSVPGEMVEGGLRRGAFG